MFFVLCVIPQTFLILFLCLFMCFLHVSHWEGPPDKPFVLFCFVLTSHAHLICLHLPITMYVLRPTLLFLLCMYIFFFLCAINQTNYRPMEQSWAQHWVFGKPGLGCLFTSLYGSLDQVVMNQVLKTGVRVWHSSCLGACSLLNMMKYQ